MNIHVEEQHLSIPGYYMLGPTFARYPADNGNGKELLMCTALFNGGDSGVGNLLWKSSDDGEHWVKMDFIEKSYQCDSDGSMMKVGGNAALYTDTEAGVILFTSNEMYWNKNNFSSTKQCSRQFYRLSFDNGRTWSDKKYIITPGHTPDAPIEDVVYGRNFALSMASQTRRTDDGHLLVALQCQIVDSDGNLVEPAGFHFFQSGALLAKWNSESLCYDWEMSQYVRVTPEESTRGVFEPTFARLSDGKYLMVMRNSNMKDASVIGQKFYSVSEDNGCHWSRPKPFTYDDGSVMYSSSSVPKFLEHSNGRLYYIGIITAENANGNGPRWPLCIAEVDREKCCVIRSTVTLIDTEREYHRCQKETAVKQLSSVDYSNHGVYEDRKGRIIVYAPFRRNLERWENVLNRYVIEL